MITVYVFGNAPPPVWGVTRDLRVVWALEETGLAYRLHPLDFAKGELKSAEYRRFQPFGQIPAIDDDGFRLFESAAIVLYVADTAGMLLPESREGRALAELFVIDHFAAGESWAKQRRPVLAEWAATRLADLDRELGRRPYLLGHTFSAPDILMSTVLRLVQHTDLLSAAPNVAAYQARCEARPAWSKVLAAHQQRLAA